MADWLPSPRSPGYIYPDQQKTYTPVGPLNMDPAQTIGQTNEYANWLRSRFTQPQQSYANFLEQNPYLTQYMSQATTPSQVQRPTVGGPTQTGMTQPGSPTWIQPRSATGSPAPSWLQGPSDIYGAYNVAKGELGAAPDVMGAYGYARSQLRGAPDVYGAYNLAEQELHPTADVLGTYGQLRSMLPDRGTLDARRFEDPFDVSAMRQRGADAIQYQMREQAMPAILEAMGARGNRYSSSANEAVIRQQGLLGLELEKLYSPMELQAYEGAAGREVAMREIAARLEQGDQQGATAALNAWTQAQEGAAGRAAQLAGQGLNLWGTLEDSARGREAQLTNQALGIWGTTQNADLDRRAALASQGLGLWSTAQDKAAERAMQAGENWANRDLTAQESFADRTFRGGESWADRAFRGEEAMRARQFAGDESWQNRQFQGDENWANRMFQSQEGAAGRAGSLANLMAQLGMQDYQRRNPSDVELSQMAMNYFNRKAEFPLIAGQQAQFDRGVTMRDFIDQMGQGIKGASGLLEGLFGNDKQAGLLSSAAKGVVAAGGSIKDLYNWITSKEAEGDFSNTSGTPIANILRDSGMGPAELEQMGQVTPLALWSDYTGGSDWMDNYQFGAPEDYGGWDLNWDWGSDMGSSDWGWY